MRFARTASLIAAAAFTATIAASAWPTAAQVPDQPVAFGGALPQKLVLPALAGDSVPPPPPLPQCISDPQVPFWIPPLVLWGEDVQDVGELRETLVLGEEEAAFRAALVDAIESSLTLRGVDFPSPQSDTLELYARAELTTLITGLQIYLQAVDNDDEVLLQTGDNMWASLVPRLLAVLRYVPQPCDQPPILGGLGAIIP